MSQNEISIIKNLIVSPYPSVELIGNFDLLNSGENIVICYTNTDDLEDGNKIREESLELKGVNKFRILAQIYSKDLPLIYLKEKESTLYFPDPYFEVDPVLRKWGAYGEGMLRSGHDVVFYSVDMLAPYIYLVEDSNRKIGLIKKYYSKPYDISKRYIYEGRCKWMI